MQTFGPLPFSMMLHIAKSRPITSTAGFCVTLFWEGVKITLLGLREGSRYQIGWIFGKILNGLWPPPPHFWKSMLQFFYNGYGCIYARRYEGQSVSSFDFSQYNTLNPDFTLNNFMLKKVRNCHFEPKIAKLSYPNLIKYLIEKSKILTLQHLQTCLTTNNALADKGCSIIGEYSSNASVLHRWHSFNWMQTSSLIGATFSQCIWIRQYHFKLWVSGLFFHFSCSSSHLFSFRGLKMSNVSCDAN